MDATSLPAGFLPFSEVPGNEQELIYTGSPGGVSLSYTFSPCTTTPRTTSDDPDLTDGRQRMSYTLLYSGGSATACHCYRVRPRVLVQNVTKPNASFRGAVISRTITLQRSDNDPGAGSIGPIELSMDYGPAASILGHAALSFMGTPLTGGTTSGTVVTYVLNSGSSAHASWAAFFSGTAFTLALTEDITMINCLTSTQQVPVRVAMDCGAYDACRYDDALEPTINFATIAQSSAIQAWTDDVRTRMCGAPFSACGAPAQAEFCVGDAVNGVGHFDATFQRTGTTPLYNAFVEISRKVNRPNDLVHLVAGSLMYFNAGSWQAVPPCSGNNYPCLDQTLSVDMATGCGADVPGVLEKAIVQVGTLDNTVPSVRLGWDMASCCIASVSADYSMFQWNARLNYFQNCLEAPSAAGPNNRMDEIAFDVNAVPPPEYEGPTTVSTPAFDGAEFYDGSFELRAPYVLLGTDRQLVLEFKLDPGIYIRMDNVQTVDGCAGVNDLNAMAVVLNNGATLTLANGGLTYLSGGVPNCAWAGPNGCGATCQPGDGAPQQVLRVGISRYYNGQALFARNRQRLDVLEGAFVNFRFRSYCPKDQNASTCFSPCHDCDQGCEGPSTGDITLTLIDIPDHQAPCYDGNGQGCEYAITGATKTLYLRCPGCTRQGIHSLSYDIHRVTFGKPDEDNNGLPDAGGEMTEADVLAGDHGPVRRYRAMFSDEVEGTLNTKVVIEPRYPGDPLVTDYQPNPAAAGWSTYQGAHAQPHYGLPYLYYENKFRIPSSYLGTTGKCTESGGYLVQPRTLHVTVDELSDGIIDFDYTIDLNVATNFFEAPGHPGDAEEPGPFALFKYDLSPGSVNGQGSAVTWAGGTGPFPAGYLFTNGAKVVVKTKYQVVCNINLNIDEIDALNHIYLSRVAEPAGTYTGNTVDPQCGPIALCLTPGADCDPSSPGVQPMPSCDAIQYYCTSMIGAFKVAGYSLARQNLGHDGYGSPACVANSRCGQSSWTRFDLLIASAGVPVGDYSMRSGRNWFPHEYRNWFQVTDLQLEPPLGYKTRPTGQVSVNSHYRPSMLGTLVNVSETFQYDDQITNSVHFPNVENTFQQGDLQLTAMDDDHAYWIKAYYYPTCGAVTGQLPFRQTLKFRWSDPLFCQDAPLEWRYNDTDPISEYTCVSNGSEAEVTWYRQPRIQANLPPTITLFNEGAPALNFQGTTQPQSIETNVRLTRNPNAQTAQGEQEFGSVCTQWVAWMPQDANSLVTSLAITGYRANGGAILTPPATTLCNPFYGNIPAGQLVDIGCAVENVLKGLILDVGYACGEGIPNAHQRFVLYTGYTCEELQPGVTLQDMLGTPSELACIDQAIYGITPVYPQLNTTVAAVPAACSTAYTVTFSNQAASTLLLHGLQLPAIPVGSHVPVASVSFQQGANTYPGVAVPGGYAPDIGNNGTPDIMSIANSAGSPILVRFTLASTCNEALWGSSERFIADLDVGTICDPHFMASVELTADPDWPFGYVSGSINIAPVQDLTSCVDETTAQLTISNSSDLPTLDGMTVLLTLPGELSFISASGACLSGIIPTTGGVLLELNAIAAFGECDLSITLEGSSSCEAGIVEISAALVFDVGCGTEDCEAVTASTVAPVTIGGGGCALVLDLATNPSTCGGPWQVLCGAFAASNGQSVVIDGVYYQFVNGGGAFIQYDEGVWTLTGELEGVFDPSLGYWFQLYLDNEQDYNSWTAGGGAADVTSPFDPTTWTFYEVSDVPTWESLLVGVGGNFGNVYDLEAQGAYGFQFGDGANTNNGGSGASLRFDGIRRGGGTDLSGKFLANMNCDFSAFDFSPCSGSIGGTITGGTAPYSLTITGPNYTHSINSTTGTFLFDGLCNNIGYSAYTIAVTDVNDCVEVLTGIFLDNGLEPLSAEIDFTPNACEEDNGCAAAVNVSGGLAPYEAHWYWQGVVEGQEPITTPGEVLCGLATDEENWVVITDSNGCYITYKYFILETPNSTPQFEYNTTPACGATGTVALDLFFDTSAPFTIAWTGPGGFTSDELSLSGLVAGAYEVTVWSFDEGCAWTVPVVVPEDCPCEEFSTLQLSTDANGAHTSWEVLNSTTLQVVCSGSGYPSNTDGIIDQCCLPDGCYTLRVLDSAGDGMSGSYLFRDATGARIIHNADGFPGALAQHADVFCLPTGPVGPLASRCDLLTWTTAGTMICAPIPEVSALFVPGAANNQQPSNTGYEFWFFNPDGGYSKRIFNSHQVSNGYPQTETKACHLRLTHTAFNADPLPVGTLLNVRMRARVNGVNTGWGPACRFQLGGDPAACWPTQLVDISTMANHSCGVTRIFGSTATDQRLQAYQLQGAIWYRYELRKLPNGTPFTILRSSGSATNNSYLPPTWTTAVAPLPNNGDVYSIRVQSRKTINGIQTWCSYGDACTVTFVTSSGMAPLGSGEGAFTNGQALLWPNPNATGVVMLQLSDLSPELHHVGWNVYDAQGKKVMDEQLPIADGYLRSEITLPAGTRPGLYVVRIMAGTHQFVEHLVVQ